MRNVRVPAPNRGLAKILVDQPMRRAVSAKCEEGLAIYRGLAHKQSGRTARDARVETMIGGRRQDRWVGRLIVNQPTSLKRATEDLRETLRRMGGSR